MSFKHLVFAAFSTVILATTFSDSPLGKNAFAQTQYQSQSTTIDISSSELKDSYWLNIYSSDNARIQGEVKLDGKVIQSLNSASTTINIAPYLNQGQNEVIISGNYSPTNASVTVELNSKTDKVTQQTGGNGLINQILIIEVQ
ncbi:hypothetical protein PCC8801_2294 [Rippkaea orientalis PCC 8801]|uniref:Uncharacterized protein n=1 Tax=Rippkaea orientalis (strain PCC 8801 / RF-1) TaxID=41431 RepID=B7K1B8_RIPO1|nr:hypothetical protein [Rippkaea orientalis]ACK66313.1 hypothetical protein PCC8801_2294 [Rippkaea orientalis PCC 8801]